MDDQTVKPEEPVKPDPTQPEEQPEPETQPEQPEVPQQEEVPEVTEPVSESEPQTEQKDQEEVPASEEAPATTTAPGKWYVIHVKTGYEGRVKKSLEQRIKSLSVEDRIFDIVVPMRETMVVKKGKKSKVMEKVFPGYVLVRMILDDDTWLVVRTTEGITGFVGAGLKPTPISDKEVDAIMKFVQQEQPKFKTKFAVGEAVKIIEGPFSDFLGTIEGIDDARGKVKVLVSIFDRETPVELDFLQVTKL